MICGECGSTIIGSDYFECDICHKIICLRCVDDSFIDLIICKECDDNLSSCDECGELCECTITCEKCKIELCGVCIEKHHCS